MNSGSSMKWIRPVGLVLVFCALAVYIYRDIRGTLTEPQVTLRHVRWTVTVPCGKGDRARKVYDTPSGRLCIETNTKDEIW